MKAICHNGEFLAAGRPLYGADNRSFRYGDGVFETAKVVDGNLQLASLHMKRLFTSLQLLNIQPGPQFTPEVLQQHILELCQKNNCIDLGRVRLAVYRQPNGQAGYVIEAAALAADVQQLNTAGWKLVVYPLARKSCDAFANLKSANFLPYVLAGQYAAEKGADEALVLNNFNNVADGSKTNLFLVKDKTLYTPALHQGCVSGVMRLHVMQQLKSRGFVVHQTEINNDHLLGADEVFCTNAIQGIRWVGTFGDRQYNNKVIQSIYHQLFDEAGS